MWKWKWDFATLDKRDAFLDETFAERSAQESPGHFKVESGDIHVFLTTVVYNGPQIPFSAVPSPLVQFKDEGQDSDGMPVGPAWLVEYLAADGAEITGTRSEMAEGNWIRKADAIGYAKRHGYELEEV